MGTRVAHPSTDPTGSKMVGHMCHGQVKICPVSLVECVCMLFFFFLNKQTSKDFFHDIL